MAVLFNAHADRLYRGSLPVANGAYTVCMWVKPRTGSGQHEFFFESDAAGTTYCLASNNGVLGILNAGGGFTYDVTLGAAAMTEDVWYFVAMTINGTTGNLYRGTESTAVTNASGTVATQASSYRVYIGSDGSSSAYPCFADIAHVRIWDAILTESELNAERESATAVRTANISAEWRMVDAAGKLTDSSGQSRPLVAASTGPWADAADPSFGGGAVTGTLAATAPSASGSISVARGAAITATATAPTATGTTTAAHGAAIAAAAAAPTASATATAAHGVAGGAVASAPGVTASIDGAHGVSASAVATAPAAAGSSGAVHGVSAESASTAPAATGATAAAHGASATATATAPTATGSISATHASAVTGTLAATAPSASGSISAARGAAITATASAPTASATATAAHGAAVTATATSPAASGSISATHASTVTGTLAATAPSASGSISVITPYGLAPIALIVAAEVRALIPPGETRRRQIEGERRTLEIP